MAAQRFTDAVFEGRGPFAIPLLNRAVSLDNAGHPEFALVRFEFEDGSTVHVPIANQAAGDLIDFLSIHRQKLAEREASDKTGH